MFLHRKAIQNKWRPKWNNYDNFVETKKNLTTHFCYCFDKHYLRDGPACFYPVSAPLQKERKKNYDFASAISET